MSVPSVDPVRGPADDRGPAARLLASLREVRVLWREVTRLSFPGGASGLGVLTRDLAALSGRAPERTR